MKFNPPIEMPIMCMRCDKKKTISKVAEISEKNGRFRAIGKCTVCGTNTTQFLKREDVEKLKRKSGGCECDRETPVDGQMTEGAGAKRVHHRKSGSRKSKSRGSRKSKSRGSRKSKSRGSRKSKSRGSRRHKK